MGLDQYAYAISKRHVGTRQVDVALSEDGLLSGRIQRRRIGLWRNHRLLMGWMEKLYEEKRGKKGHKAGWCISFLRLNEHDLDRLEEAMKSGELYRYVHESPRQQFKQGDPDTQHNDYCHEQDLQFLREARSALKQGQAVYYNEWW
jgi:hypothetical protein